MKKIIAITGGYASGKSEVLNVAKQKGFATFSCDQISRELQSEQHYKDLLKLRFGDSIFDGENLNRKKLASMVFYDELLLASLNELSHKEIEKRLFEKIDACKCDTIFVEVPLLFENNMQKLFWKNILVVANFADRIERGKLRDNSTKQDILQRINCQMTDNEKIALADFTINNDGDKTQLREQFEKILRILFE